MALAGLHCAASVSKDLNKIGVIIGILTAEEEIAANVGNDVVGSSRDLKPIGIVSVEEAVTVNDVSIAVNTEHHFAADILDGIANDEIVAACGAEGSGKGTVPSNDGTD